MKELSELPIFKSFGEIRNALQDVINLVIKSPTGSGKSLGLPLLLLRENLIDGLIIVVQPRRIAARFLAKKAADLTHSKVGDLIGYQVRFENKTSNDTKLVYVTDGVLFRKILSDRFLSRVGMVIFDEFHERSLQMDISLALLKDLQKKQRPSLRLIITSATLQSQNLNKYLGNSHIIELEARNYPVEILYRKCERSESIWKKISLEIKRHINKYDGHILVFVSGAYEITKVIYQINSEGWSKGFKVCALHGEMRLDDQEEVIKQNDKRKIIVSTNIAETSLTIEGIQVVIDTGLAKKSAFDPVRGVNILIPQKISKSSADQRAGRAGRTGPGFCIRLWSKNDHDCRDDFEPSAVARLDISEIYLNLCAIGEDPQSIPWFEAPPENSLIRARRMMVKSGALNSDGEITEKGEQIVKFPINPRLGMALLTAKELGCLPAFALLLALTEDRSPIIYKDFKRDLISANQFKTSNNGNYSELDSDLKLLLSVWAYAKEESFSIDRCKYVGIHAIRCQEAEKLALRFCTIAKQENCSFEFPDMHDLSKVMLIAFSDQIAYLKSRGTKIYLSSSGAKLHLSKRSEVKEAKWVIPLKIVEKPIKGIVNLEMEFVTGIDEKMITDVFQASLEKKSEVILNPENRKVIRRNFNQFGEIKFNIKESESVSEQDISVAYTNELISENLTLKKWDSKVNSFLNRIEFINQNYPDYGLSPFDKGARDQLFSEVCSGAKSWKEIKNKEVLPVLMNLYSEEELELLQQAAPTEIFLSKNKRAYRIVYNSTKALVRVKIQDLYDVHNHPRISFNNHLLTLEILAPNDRCVQITDNLNEFWTGSYTQIKKELSGRYPKHEWR